MLYVWVQRRYDSNHGAAVRALWLVLDHWGLLLFGQHLKTPLGKTIPHFVGFLDLTVWFLIPLLFKILLSVLMKPELELTLLSFEVSVGPIVVLSDSLVECESTVHCQHKWVCWSSLLRGENLYLCNNGLFFILDLQPWKHLLRHGWKQDDQRRVEPDSGAHTAVKSVKGRTGCRQTKIHMTCVRTTCTTTYSSWFPEVEPSFT